MFLAFTANAFSQTFDSESYPNGTSTIAALKAEYTKEQIETMLATAEMERDVKIPNMFGFVLTDKEAKKKLVCGNEVNMILFSYIEILLKKIKTLELRLKSAQIP